jgi:hypothetical protein
MKKLVSKKLVSKKLITNQLRTVEYNGNKIEYYLTYKNVKNINLRIRSSDGTVQVSASPRVNVCQIDEFVAENGGFISDALKRYSLAKSRAEQFAGNGLNSGDEVFVLGKRLKIKLVTSDTEGVQIDDEYITIAVSDVTDYAKKSALLDNKLEAIRNEVFIGIVDKIYPVFERMNIKRPEIIFKDGVSRWGYCQPKKGIIMMNKQLVGVPVPLIEYLALHELSHLIYPNHSKEYWDFVSRLMPDCHRRRKILQQYGFLLKNGR